MENHGRICWIKIKTCNNLIYGGREDEDKKGTKKGITKKSQVIKAVQKQLTLKIK